MASELKSYPARWEGQLVLACKKCQRKLKRDDEPHELAKLRKVAKKLNKQADEKLLHVIDVPCMDLCPKDAVTVCVPRVTDERLYILRTREDLLKLLG
jgi:predicted metal-binding protein